MSAVLDRRLQALGAAAESLRGGRCGIEKESLRVTPDGYISARPHPVAFGSALTNRYITADYSEALLEFVTPPMESPWALVGIDPSVPNARPPPARRVHRSWSTVRSSSRNRSTQGMGGVGESDASHIATTDARPLAVAV